jgi:tetratricopeptide (TPR) repeat protein
MPANVLIGSDATAWMRLGVPIAFQYDLATSPDLSAAFVHGASGAYQMRATALLRTTVEKRRGGRIRVQAVLSDLATQRNRRVIEADASSEEALLSTLNSVAKQIEPRSTSFSTASVRGLQAFTAAAESSDLRQRIHDLRAAIEADPNFGLAYMLLLNTVALTGEQNTAAAIRQVTDRFRAFTPLDQARLNEIMARLKHAGLQKQETTAAAVLKLAPNDVDTLAALGSARFLQGDAEGGRRFLRRALELSPDNNKLRQDLAHGLIQTKRYAEAGKLLTNPADLAVCLLLAGNASQANATMDKMMQSLGSAELKTLFRANWLAISGDVNKAIETVQGGTFTNLAAHSAGLVQVAFWQSMTHDFAGAQRSAAQAYRLAGNRGTLTAIAQLLTRAKEPPAQWRRDVESASLDKSSAQTLLGYGYFLYGRYPEAVQVWEEMVNQSGNTDLHARAMLAASLEHAGRAGEARRVRVQPFIPEFGDIYAPISFNEMRRLIQ